jgi:nucleotide-binding universal stress UspA family protein
VTCHADPVMTVLLCTDGSPLATTALRRGLEVVGAAGRIVVATVVELTHPVDIVGGGHAGGVVSPAAADHADEVSRAGGQRLLDDAVAQLALAGAETVVLDGAPGPALCQLAEALPASVMVLGSRGIGGLRRAVLGSVSDHVVRNAPCPVVVSSA